MSSVETGQMSAVEAGQMSAAETGQMSSAETRQMSTGQGAALSHQFTFVLSQQKTSVLSQHTMLMSQKSQLWQCHNVQVADRRLEHPFLVFQQLAKVSSSLDSHCDSVHGDAIGLKSYFTDAELWHLHLSIFLADKQCVVQTEEMSVVKRRDVCC